VKHITDAVWSQPVSGVSAVNLLVAFYDIHGKKGETPLLFSFVPISKGDNLLRLLKNEGLIP
jgi:hypothetical protein